MDKITSFPITISHFERIGLMRGGLSALTREPFLAARLAEAGCILECQSKLIEFAEDGDGIRAAISCNDREEETGVEYVRITRGSDRGLHIGRYDWQAASDRLGRTGIAGPHRSQVCRSSR